MKVLVCGSRHFDDDDYLYETLNEIHGTYDARGNISEIIHGGAPGADILAGEFAKDYRIPVRRFDALWVLHGKSAGPIRNRQMLVEGHPELVVAFWDGKSPGTKDMIDAATKAGIPVRIVNDWI